MNTPAPHRGSPLLYGRALTARLRGRPAPLRIALAIALVAGVALAQVHLRLQVIEGGYAIARESRLRRDLEDQNQKLRLELATRRDPATIERRARDELHMTSPDPAAIRTLRNPLATERAGNPLAGGAAAARVPAVEERR